MKNFKNVFRAAKLTFKCDKKYIFIKVAAVLLNSFLTFASLYISKLLIDVLISQEPSFKLAIFYLILGIAVNLALVLKNFLQARYYPKIDLKLTYQVQETLIKTVSEVEYYKFDVPEFYDSMEYALRETNGLTKTIDLFLNTLAAVIDLGTAVILCLRYDFIIPLILLPGIVPYYHYPQFTRNYTPQNGIISPFSALSSISVLPGTLLSSALKMKKFSPFELSRVKRHKICAR